MINFELNNIKYSLISDKIEDIYLFGSYARDEQDIFSDIDLLIIIQDSSDYEYSKLRQTFAKQLNLPMKWISLYQQSKIIEMTKKGSYFLWHIKLEGQILYSKNNFLRSHLTNLNKYTSVLEDLDDYQTICSDIFDNIDDDFVDLTYELSVLASIIRNTSIAIDYMFDIYDFGRQSAVKRCNDLLKDRINIPIDKYNQLYEYRLYITNKKKNISLPSKDDVIYWLGLSTKLISLGREVYYERKYDKYVE